MSNILIIIYMYPQLILDRNILYVGVLEWVEIVMVVVGVPSIEWAGEGVGGGGKMLKKYYLMFHICTNIFMRLQTNLKFLNLS